MLLLKVARKNASQFCLVGRAPGTQPVFVGMFHGPSSHSSPGSSKEILVAISQIYLAIRAPFAKHSRRAFLEFLSNMHSIFVSFFNFYAVRSSSMRAPRMLKKV